MCATRWDDDTVWAEIIDKVDDHSYMDGVARSAQRVAANGEVFTPTELVVEILRGRPSETFAPGKTVLDPACGDGQFLVTVKWIKVLLWGMTEAEATQDLYGIDIMADNVELCRRRLGGATILVGDALRPMERCDGQSEDDHIRMLELFM